MIVCRDCGHGNESDDAFCGSCGAFLEWTGEAVVADEPVVVVTDEVDEDGPGLVDRLKTAVGIDGGAAGSGGGPDVADEATAAVEAARAEADAASERTEREEAEARQKAEAEAAARAEAEEARRRVDAEAAEARARAEAEAEARREAERTAMAQAAAEAAEARAAAEAEAERLRVEAETARVEAERAVREAAAREAEAQAQSEAESARAREEAERARAEAEAARVEAARVAAENKKRLEEEAAAARAEAERLKAEADAAREEAEAQARAREEAEAAEAQAREEAEAAQRRTEAEAAARAAAEAAAASARAEEERRKKELTERAAAMVAAPKVVEEASEPAASTGAMKPVIVDKKKGGVGARPPVVQPKPNPGDLICGECGQFNAPERKFCRRCGHSLVEAKVVKTPLWRKVLRRRRKTVAAGERPGWRSGSGSGSGREAARTARHGWRRFLSLRGKARALFGFLAILGIASVTIGPLRTPGQDALERVRRIISPTYEPVRPVSATASSSSPGREPGRLIDGIRNSFWAEGAEGPGIGETITITFAEPTDIDRIGIIPGATETPEQFVAQPRPRDLHIVFEGEDVTSDDISVADSSDFQDFDVGGRRVTRVVIEIRSAHLGTEGSDLAIAELEFFVKK